MSSHVVSDAVNSKTQQNMSQHDSMDGQETCIEHESETVQYRENYLNECNSSRTSKHDFSLRHESRCSAEPTGEPFRKSCSVPETLGNEVDVACDAHKRHSLRTIIQNNQKPDNDNCAVCDTIKEDPLVSALHKHGIMNDDNKVRGE